MRADWFRALMCQILLTFVIFYMIHSWMEVHVVYHEVRAPRDGLATDGPVLCVPPRTGGNGPDSLAIVARGRPLDVEGESVRPLHRLVLSPSGTPRRGERDRSASVEVPR